MAEFCPKCGTPLETAQDPARLCDLCGWFGDWTEVLSKPPAATEVQPVRSVMQALAFYRDVCRKELEAEIVCRAGRVTEADLRKVRVAARECRDALVQLFTALHRPHAAPPAVLKYVNGLVPWPREWTDYRYNACNEPCDMLVGPCACGAWHQDSEDWVREVLARHNTVIRP
jgi:hypothetical protein